MKFDINWITIAAFFTSTVIGSNFTAFSKSPRITTACWNQVFKSKDDLYFLLLDLVVQTMQEFVFTPNWFLWKKSSNFIPVTPSSYIITSFTMHHRNARAFFTSLCFLHLKHKILITIFHFEGWLFTSRVFKH